LAERWSEQNAIPLATDMNMLDAGVSAFKGRNLESGALGAFLQAARDGKIERGSYLLVESIDRISREGMFPTAAIVQELWKAGIIIVTLSDNRTYQPDCNDMDALMIVLTAMRAREESVTKGKRIKASYIRRNAHAAATGEVVSGNLPGWLFKGEDRKAHLNPQKAAIVERIFDLSLAGCGLPKIAMTLNDAGVKPFAMDKRRKGRAEYWTIANVAYILNSKATYGLYAPPKSEASMMFPPVITIETFNRAQAGMANRFKFGKGRKGKCYSNLFGSIAKCHYCKEPMTIRNPKKGRATQFYCKGSLTGNCQESAPWNYERFEASFLAFVSEIDLLNIVHGGIGSRQDSITQEIQQLEGERLGVQKDQQNLIGMIRENEILKETLTPDMVKNAYRLKAISDKIQALEIERNKIQSEREASHEDNRLWFPKVGTGPGEVSGEELYKLRAKAAEHIRTIVERIELDRPHLGKRYRKAADETSDPVMKAHWLEQAKIRTFLWDNDSKYVVHFKGGASRMVYPNNFDASKAKAVVNTERAKELENA